MAIDQWLFNQCANAGHPSVLRFYTWSPPAISLGKNQHRWPQHWQQLSWQQQSIDLVRRPSGGRAVLHQGDLTYMLVVNNPSGNRRETYRALCEFLIQGWKTLGIALHFGNAGRGYMSQPNCFATATDADLILTDGTKLIGSAQAWQGTTVLQHGSIRLKPDPELYAQVFGKQASVAGSSSVRGMDSATLIKALRKAAEHCFQMQLQDQKLSTTEWNSVNAMTVHTSITS